MYLSFPELFSKGRFGYHYIRETLMSICLGNQRLLNCTQRFSLNSHYIIYAQSVLQRINCHNQISIAMRKMSSVGLYASMF